MALSWSRVTKLSSSSQQQQLLRRRGLQVNQQLFLHHQQQCQGMHPSTRKLSLLSITTRTNTNTYRQNINNQWNRYYHTADRLRGTSVMATSNCLITSCAILPQSTNTTTTRQCSGRSTIRRDFHTTSSTNYIAMPNKNNNKIRAVVGVGTNSTTTMVSNNHYGDIVIRAISTRYNEDWTKWLIPRKGTGKFMGKMYYTFLSFPAKTPQNNGSVCVLWATSLYLSISQICLLLFPFHTHTYFARSQKRF